MDDLLLNEPGFVTLPSDQMQAASRRYFLQIRRLADKHRRKQAAEDQKFLAKIMELVVSQPDVAEWDPSLKAAFVDLVSALLGAELIAIEAEGSLKGETVADLRAKADWLCNLALAGKTTASADPLMRALRFWIRLRIFLGFSDSELESLIARIAKFAGAFGIELETFADHTKVEAVLYGTSGSRSGTISESAQENLKAWCRGACCTIRFRNAICAAHAAVRH